jgi:hypothetical protein
VPRKTRLVIPLQLAREESRMRDNPAKVFSLAEANKLVPVVAEFTAEATEKLNQIRRRHKIDSEDMTSSVPEPVLKEIEALLKAWSDRVVQLGALPKGYFTVDFLSIDPELLYCWSYGEDKIAFTHKVWENFSHRRPLAESVKPAMDHLRWVN